MQKNSLTFLRLYGKILVLNRGAGEQEYFRRIKERFSLTEKKGVPAEARQPNRIAAAGRAGEYPPDCHRRVENYYCKASNFSFCCSCLKADFVFPKRCFFAPLFSAFFRRYPPAHAHFFALLPFCAAYRRPAEKPLQLFRGIRRAYFSKLFLKFVKILFTGEIL